MTYFYTKTIDSSFEEAIEIVTKRLAEKGFGILTKIDAKATFKAKLDKDFRPYVILGACNPNFAYSALNQEPNLGVLMPCSVTVQQHANGQVEISAINPAAAFSVIGNDKLTGIVKELDDAIAGVINNL